MSFFSNTAAFLIALVFSIAGFHAASIGTSKLEDEFHLVGAINNKTYYTPKNNTLTNWDGGRYICNQSGLELASFAGYGEYQFVRTNLPNDSNHNMLWIGGSLKGQFKHQPTSYQWLDESDLEVELSGLYYHTPSLYLCLIFSRDAHLYPDVCISGRHKALCQTSSANSTGAFL